MLDMKTNIRIMDTSAIAPLAMKPFCSSCFLPERDGGANHRKGTSSKRAFCISGLIVTTTTDSSLESAGCGVKTGWCMPLTASLAALVRVCTTWLHQSGKMVSHRIIGTRSAHLAHIVTLMQGGAGRLGIFLSVAPLSACLLNN